MEKLTELTMAKKTKKEKMGSLLKSGERDDKSGYGDELDLGEKQFDNDAGVETSKTIGEKTWGSAVRAFVTEVMAESCGMSKAQSSELDEYVVPMGFSLSSWKEYSEKNKKSAKTYSREHPGTKYKVVHGSKESSVGEPLPGLSNVSYEKASTAHRGIAASKGK